MRDNQVETFLATWNGFSRGLISMTEPPKHVSLSAILESEVGAKYCLSPKACRGILRRSEKRGKSLPPSLRLALEQVAQQDKETS